MPREQLLGLAADVDRLLAAGATAAAGHDSLSRRGRTLRELGQKVAALVPVADAVERVTSCSSREVGRHFLDLVVMARQLRGSLAGTGPEGTLQAVETSGPWQTPTPVRDVYNAHESLTGSGSSAVLREAAEREVTGDLRLLPSALAALDNSNSTLADVVADKILPAVGRAVLPDLLAKMELKQGKAADTRRLRAICKIDPKTGAELCRKGLSEGSPQLKIQALECLPDVGRPGEAEKAGLEMWKDKKKDVRVAALGAVRKATSDEALEIAMQALLQEDDEIVSRATEVLVELPHPRATERLLAQVEERSANLPPPVPKPKKGAKKAARKAAEKAEEARDEEIMRLRRFMEVLAGRSDAKKGRPLKTLLALAHHDEAEVRSEAVDDLAKIGPEVKEVVPALIEAVGDTDDNVAESAVQALSGFPPEKREAALPTLLQRAADPKTYEDIVSSIVEMLPQHMNRFGDKSLALLRQLLPSKNDWVGYHVLEALEAIGPPAQELLPDVVDYLKGDRGVLYEDKVFVSIEPEGTTAIPALIELLSHKKSRVRGLALQALSAYGTKAQAAEPSVTKLLKDRDSWVKHMAQSVLPVIKGEA